MGNSRRIWDNRLTSLIAFIGASNPPLKRESGPPVLKILDGESSGEGIDFLI